MCKFKNLGVSWPPKGWKQLGDLESTYGQAILKNPASALVTGLSYLIEPIPIVKADDQRGYDYVVNVSGWEYNIYNESREYSILSYVLHERTETQLPKHIYMSDLKAKAQSLPVVKRSCHRIFMASLFLMKQISINQVPETDRILKLYKIHPAQRSLYNDVEHRDDSLYCGLTGFNKYFDETKVV